MKILYAVQATGNGHISRAHELYPYLQEMGEVDILLSGSNSTLDCAFPVKYRSKGLSLFYGQCGTVDYRKTIVSANLLQVHKDAIALPVEKYDLILNDFDFVTARACKLKNRKSIQFGHQASFASAHTPRPKKRDFIGETILRKYAVASDYVGLHFLRYDSFIFEPIIKQEFIDARPQDHGHITVYLPAYQPECPLEIFKEFSNYQFHWFLPSIQEPYVEDNIHYFPIKQNYFNESLIYCHGLLTGGGFETPSEGLYMNKKLLTIPIAGQYEQQCNAAALAQMGILKMDILDHSTKDKFNNWLHSPKQKTLITANNINATLDYIANLAHKNESPVLEDLFY